MQFEVGPLRAAERKRCVKSRTDPFAAHKSGGVLIEYPIAASGNRGLDFARLMKQILCDVCHERPANNHICDGNTGKTSDLCAECFETSAPPEVRQSIAEMREAHCQYCDGEVFMGGTDTDALIFGVQQVKYMCKSCFFEHNRYMQQELGHLNKNVSQQEQLESLRTLNIAAENYMKKWVSERGSR